MQGAGPERDHRLDGDHQALRQRLADGRIGVVGDGRRLVDRAPDAVAGELAQHVAAAPLDLLLDRAADGRDRAPGAGGLEALAQRGAGGGDEAPDRRPGRPDGDRDRRVGVVAVELRRDVELHELAGAQAAGARDAVHDLIVDADADGAGEVVGEPGCRAGAVAREYAGGGAVELRRGHAGADEAAHLAQSGGDDPAGGLDALEVFGGLDGHGLGGRYRGRGNGGNEGGCAGRRAGRSTGCTVPSRCPIRTPRWDCPRARTRLLTQRPVQAAPLDTAAYCGTIPHMTGATPNTSRLLVLAAALCFATTGTAQELGPAGLEPVAVGAARIAVGGALLA